MLELVLIVLVFLKSCNSVLIRPLHLIFKKSLNSGHFPKMWKRSFVTPMDKSGDKQNVINYRPIYKSPLFQKCLKLFYKNFITKRLSLFVSPSYVKTNMVSDAICRFPLIYFFIKRRFLQP
jgi:hypothetical protein